MAVAKSVAKEEEDKLDRELLAEIGQGTRASFTKLYEKYYTPITRFAYRHVRETQVIEEVVNDTMMVVWQKAEQFRGDSKVSTWIMGIALRKCWEAINKAKHHDIPTDEIPETIDTQDSFAEMDTRSAVDFAMQKLSTDHRSTIELAYYMGYTCEEIAVVMDCPQNTVKTRLHYARKVLKKTLKHQEMGLG